MEDAIAISASARLERMDAARIAASGNMLADAARKSNLAEEALTEARKERAEARELLTMANKLRDAAADADEIAFLRRQLRRPTAALTPFRWPWPANQPRWSLEPAPVTSRNISQP